MCRDSHAQDPDSSKATDPAEDARSQDRDRPLLRAWHAWPSSAAAPAPLSPHPDPASPTVPACEYSFPAPDIQRPVYLNTTAKDFQFRKELRWKRQAGSLFFARNVQSPRDIFDQVARIFDSHRQTHQP